MKIIYVGDIQQGQTCLGRMQALQRLGHEVIGVQSQHPVSGGLRGLAGKVSRRYLRRWADPRANALLAQAIQDIQDVALLWIDRGMQIDPRLLDRAREVVPDVRIVGYLPDDILNPFNRSRELLKGLPRYDVVFTNRSFQTEELEALGAPRAEQIGKSFDPGLHRPVKLSDEERLRLGGPLGFIGTVEQQRAQSMVYLAEHGVPVKVWGNGWARWVGDHRVAIEVAGPTQYGEIYPKLINAFDINVCFLRKANRDWQTSRTFEIPACGAFMLAERTPDHLELYQEGKEAEFFDSDEELLEKARYYLAHPHQRRRVAAAGHQRCWNSGYSTDARMSQMLKRVTDRDAR